MDISNGVIFADTLLALLVAHQIGDHWVQTDAQAAMKGRRGHVGAEACLRHVLSYTCTTAVMVGVVWSMFDLDIHPAAFLAGQLVSAVTHYWVDRRFTLAWLAGVTGIAGFHALGTPRPDRDDNPSLGTGAYALDQSFHWLWLFVAALVTTLG